MDNMMPGDNSGADGPSHGSETAIFQELVKIRNAFDKWRHEYRSDFLNDDDKAFASEISDDLFELSELLNVKL